MSFSNLIHNFCSIFCFIFVFLHINIFLFSRISIKLINHISLLSSSLILSINAMISLYFSFNSLFIHIISI